MQESNLDETKPTTISTPESTAGEAPKTKKRPWIRFILLGWALLVLVAAIGGYRGYQKGIEDRVALQTTETAEDIERQYQLGLEDFQNENYERARQRFEFIIDQNPNHERAIEMLARTLSILNATATPTPVTPTVTPTLSPTPDLRSAEELFEQANQDMAAENWTSAINTLLNLRKDHPNFMAIDVDSMFYVALRNRGVNKILTTGELEGGLYDLAQAELFGPLDVEAQNVSNWARLYQIGASFWQVNWAQAAFYFGQVAPFAPNLHDGTGWSATERYRTAMKNYIDLLAEAEEWCEAEEQMEILRTSDPDPQLEATQTRLQNKCNPPRESEPEEEENTPEPPSEPTSTPPPQREVPPTETPSP